MKDHHFAMLLTSWLVVVWALVALPLIAFYIVWTTRRSSTERDLPEPPPHLVLRMSPADARLSLDNTRRARVQSETGHLPPSVVHLNSPPHMRTAEDCQ
jgi:hypothetical protein